KILICPLEWGLGHAGRCIPLAAEFKARGYKVVFGAGKRHLSFLKREFPDAETIEFPGFNPTYSKWLPMWLVIVIKSPSLIYHIIKDHIELPKIIQKTGADMVLSDNRFGLWSSRVTTIYMTHQVRIKFPRWTLFLEPLGCAIHRFFIKKYDYCLIPDLPGENNLSGELSHCRKMPINTSYIGILSRFTCLSHAPDLTKGVDEIHDTVILSGPEPQKTILRRCIMNAYTDSTVQVVILGAEPDIDDSSYSEGKFIMFNHLPTAEMKKVILSSREIITRSGYSTVMELASMNRSALLIPTPGQTEQEYLAKKLSENGLLTFINKTDLSNISHLFPKRRTCDAKPVIEESSKILEKSIDRIVSADK
ncbi:MAG: hypothetical protein J6W61_03765, partial [Bacteroidales bacterium]|nr:hypothetical protein [Bacteroidales bacterium]